MGMGDRAGGAGEIVYEGGQGKIVHGGGHVWVKDSKSVRVCVSRRVSEGVSQ